MTATAVRTTTPVSRSRSCEYAGPAAAAVVVLALATLSMFVGVSDVSLPALLTGDPTAVEIFWISRVLRTLAVVLAGMAVAVAGLIMQLMARNRFVEPSTVGTVESATLGILVVTVFIPTAPILLRMGVASVFAVLGTALFLAILRRLPTRNTLLIPLVGIMLGGVIAAVTTNLGLNYTATMRLGLIIVSLCHSSAWWCPISSPSCSATTCAAPCPGLRSLGQTLCWCATSSAGPSAIRTRFRWTW